jgi:16S rRNA (cytosine967-C5)-methyltransferase
MTTPAAQARACAAQIITAVVHGRSLDAALDEHLAMLGPTRAREQPLVQEMSYGVLRLLLALEPVLHGLLDKPLKDKDDDLRALLAVGLYQLLFMRVAPHAALKETVEATCVLGKDWAKGFVNAVLRRAQRELETLRARINDDETRAHPPWLVEQLRSAWPEHWRAILEANNARAPLALRVNMQHGTRAEYLAQLTKAGLAASPHPDVDTAVMLDTPVPVERLPGFSAGLVSVQDAAAQLAAPLLDAQPGMRVLDACSAPGGKAAHLLERTPNLDLTALDHDRTRLQRIKENFARLGLAGRLVAGDAARPADWWDGKSFDRILLDAPCSATGVIRRHPDIRLHRTPADIEQLAATQARLLAALWPLLAPGGKLLYVTCSVLPRENDAVVENFLAATPDAQRAALAHPALTSCARETKTGHALRTGCGNMDGFYYAALVRAGAAA